MSCFRAFSEAEAVEGHWPVQALPRNMGEWFLSPLLPMPLLHTPAKGKHLPLAENKFPSFEQVVLENIWNIPSGIELPLATVVIFRPHCYIGSSSLPHGHIILAPHSGFWNCYPMVLAVESIIPWEKNNPHLELC